MKSSGFSLLEIMVVITLLSLMSAIVVPRLRIRTPMQERKQFVDQLNALTKFAWQNAITSGKIQKVSFDLKKMVVTFSESTGKKDQRGGLITKNVKRIYRGTALKILPQLVLKNFYIEGVDEVAQHGAGKKLTEAYFYIVPDGLTQSVIINFLDIKERAKGIKGVPLSLILNPFTAEFKVYGTFQTPK